MTFKIIDTQTGKEPTDRVITNIAKKGGLMIADIDQFFVGEDGTLSFIQGVGRITSLLHDIAVTTEWGAVVIFAFAAATDGQIHWLWFSQGDCLREDASRNERISQGQVIGAGKDVREVGQIAEDVVVVIGPLVTEPIAGSPAHC